VIWLLALGGAEPAWKRHPAADALISVQAFPAAGPDAWFALHRRWSDLDRDPEGLRPYVFRIDERGELVELWRGSGLAWPLVDARVVQIGAETRLCAVHRGDSFLAPDPANTARRLAVYAWTGFGFVALADPAALAACAW
jgi:poly-gamma-glutamate synthesis protein (capsule biosynthesis protein)